LVTPLSGVTTRWAWPAQRVVQTNLTNSQKWQVRSQEYKISLCALL